MPDLLEFSCLHHGLLGVDSGNKNWDEYDAMSFLPDGTIAVVTTHYNNAEEACDDDYRNLVSYCYLGCNLF